MTSTPTTCRHYWIVRDGISLCRDCDATAPIAQPRQPDTSAERDERLSALQAKCDAYEKEIAHALRYLREIGAGDERLRGEPEFEMLESFEQVLAAHKRGGGE